MFEPNQLAQDIEQAIASMQGRKHPEWITQAVCDKHRDINGADADFWTVAGRAEIRSRVRAALNRFKVKAEVEPNRQIVLAGFERLQTHYLVEDDGEYVAIPVQEMTDGQWDAKEREFESMRDGLAQHLAEIRRYRDASRAAA
jgi:hypothetical protein